MKIKNYKLVYDSFGRGYDVYTNDLCDLVMRDNSNGYDIGHLYLMPSECRWKFVPRDITDVALYLMPSECRWKFVPRIFLSKYVGKPRTKEKAAKRLVKYQNRILREMRL